MYTGFATLQQKLHKNGNFQIKFILHISERVWQP